MLTDPSSYVLAAGALGTASFALVDSSKAWGGGISNRGFAQIRHAVTKLFEGTPAENLPMPLSQAIGVLRANWLNGTALADQKLIARTLIKLRLNEDNAEALAKVTGVDSVLLKSAAAKISKGRALSQPAQGAAPAHEGLTADEQNVFGRFDLILSTILDEAYQRADQIYRNSAKMASVVVSVALAFLGGWTVMAAGLTSHAGSTAYTDFWSYVLSSDCAAAVLTGLIATPLAPISKDVASGLSAASKAIGLLKK